MELLFKRDLPLLAYLTWHLIDQRKSMAAFGYSLRSFFEVPEYHTLSALSFFMKGVLLLFTQVAGERIPRWCSVSRQVKGRVRRVRPPSARAARPRRASLCAPAAPTGGTAAESARSAMFFQLHLFFMKGSVPDPAFLVNADPVPDPDLDPKSRSRVLMTKIGKT